MQNLAFRKAKRDEATFQLASSGTDYCVHPNQALGIRLGGSE